MDDVADWLMRWLQSHKLGWAIHAGWWAVVFSRPRWYMHIWLGGSWDLGPGVAALPVLPQGWPWLLQ